MIRPTASEDRPEPPLEGDERATLNGFLDFQRATLEWKCSGLDAEQLARRAMPPSTLSLLGIVRHMADVERGWFSRVAGSSRDPHYYTEDDIDLDFNGALADRAVVDEAFATWHDEIERSSAVVSDRSLDSTFRHTRGRDFSLRWVLVHMIEEYARHNGHADLLREAIDGATGE
jgi:uncharacterized damage-inducible protein DinB